MRYNQKHLAVGITFLIMAFMGFALMFFYKEPAQARVNEQSPPKFPKIVKKPASELEKAMVVEKPDGEEAFYTAQQACERGLKAPASANFSNPYTDANTGWKVYGNNQWSAFGWVEAQNALGVKLRENWEAVVEMKGEKFEVVYLKLGEEVAGKKPAVALPPTKPVTPEQLALAKENASKAKADAEAKALKFNQDAADRGEAYGQYRMGVRYAKGDGVAVDLPKARELLAKAAQQGHQAAADELKNLPPQ